jgi:diaminopimelate epimerase
MPVNLFKAHAYGNDFLLLPHADTPAAADLPLLARRLCDRHRGIGADGLIVFAETPEGARTELFNADGGRAEVSGNGLRCMAAWLVDARKLGPGAELQIHTGAGPKTLTVLSADGPRVTFRANMGLPEQLRQERLDVGGDTVAAVVMRFGNPQCVVLGEVSEARLHRVGAGLAVHPFFPEGTNVELAEVQSPARVRILIWERGVGPTEASGTGACAAAIAAAAYGGAAHDVEVVAPGGSQRVEWTDAGVWLTGWAQLVATVQMHDLVEKASDKDPFGRKATSANSAGLT